MSIANIRKYLQLFSVTYKIAMFKIIIKGSFSSCVRHGIDPNFEIGQSAYWPDINDKLSVQAKMS
jgi:hypothetical protein